MENKNERNLNITLKNEETDKEEIIISFTSIIKQLKRFLAIWLVVAIVVGILIPVGTAVFTADQHKNLSALVSFNYNGIEKGLAPDGSQFDINTLKNPNVIQAALESQGLPLDSLEAIRRSISIEGVIPSNAIDRITMYKSIYDQGNLNAGERMLDVSYFPTQYELTFNYSTSGLDGKTAVAVFQAILDNYKVYFFKEYGFNQALGSSVKALKYTDYDYAEAVDVFSDTISKMQSYVNNLNKEDTVRFRSTATGFTFADLSNSLSTLKNVDLDKISSYITVNNVTKDKSALLDYYNYRIETLIRERTVASDNLDAINSAIETYEKSVTIVYGEGQDPKEYSQNSTEYDDLFKKKIEAQNTLSSKTQAINMYQQRVNTLKGNASASQEKIDRVERELAALDEKVNEMLDLTNATANEYYETAYLSNAYTVLVPPSTSALNTTKNVLKSAMETLMIAEALILVCYILVAFGTALITDNRKARAARRKVADSDDDDSEDEPEEDAAETAEETDAEKKHEDKKKKK
ncbi:MAG: lipopolysaccharide biosynthesis protein [Oscillospiraceae bacterium]|nr:lipopolysaccharide biosynthesis protein [Oscillospiraceae bacterium]